MSNNKLVDFLQSAKQFRVRTGNISAWGELKLRTFNNPSDELVECLKLQLQKWHPTEEDLEKAHENKDGSSGFSLCQGPWCVSCQAIVQYPRDELKITIKSFLSRPNADDVRECLLAMNKDLAVSFCGLCFFHAEHTIV